MAGMSSSNCATSCTHTWFYIPINKNNSKDGIRFLLLLKTSSSGQVPSHRLNEENAFIGRTL